MEETTAAALASRIDDLIALCATLARENRALHEAQAAWQAERASLNERHELAKSKIDAMIDRLRSLDEPAGGRQTSTAAEAGDVPPAPETATETGPTKPGP